MTSGFVVSTISETTSRKGECTGARTFRVFDPSRTTKSSAVNAVTGAPLSAITVNRQECRAAPGAAARVTAAHDAAASEQTHRSLMGSLHFRAHFETLEVAVGGLADDLLVAPAHAAIARRPAVGVVLGEPHGDGHVQPRVDFELGAERDVERSH